MPTRAGVGYSENAKSFDAGVEAAQAAVTDAGTRACDLVLMYSTEKHEPAQLRDGVRSVVGPSTRLIGGYSMAIITKNRLGYDGHQVGIVAVSSDSMNVALFIKAGLV